MTNEQQGEKVSNIDRAAQIIHEHLQDNSLTRDAGDPHALAKVLQDAGLLMPDLAADQIQYRVEYEARMTEKYNAEKDKWVRCVGYWKQRQTGWVDRLEANRLLGIYSKEPRPGFTPQSRNARLVARRVSAPWEVSAK